jgi:predicted ATPase/DNA-binding CsgD family transcriptional regulator
MNGPDLPDLALLAALTAREQEVMQCIGDGLSNRQIAEQLHLAHSTVKWYVRQIFNKLGVNTRQAAIDRARALGLLPEEASERAIKQNLPRAATPFIGREEELAGLAEFIADPQVPVITIFGPGGIGKTRIALKAAESALEMRSLFPDGVFYVSLAALESAQEIEAPLATALDFQPQEMGRESRSESQQILDYLRSKRLMLVMDNFEQILGAAGFLEEICSQAVGVKLLITSRERLLLRGEQIFPLRGLEIPDWENTATEALEDNAAARLFLNIARRTSPHFELLGGDAEQLIRICRLVEGMPLGLELAAGWVGVLPLSEIADAIERGLQVLASGDHDVPSQYQSLQATLDLSWRRLKPELKRAFQELTVFRDGFTRQAAAAVADATVSNLAALVNKSWLSYDRERDRYNFHELLRQFGAEMLQADEAREYAVRDRHSAYFCVLLKEREMDWFGARQQDAAAQVRDEIDNIQIAWRWAASQGNGVPLAQGLNSLCRFYAWDGRTRDPERACGYAVDGLSNTPGAQALPDAQRLALWSQALTWKSQFVDDVAQQEQLLAQSQNILGQAAEAGGDTRAEQAHIFLAKNAVAQHRDNDEALHFAKLGLELYRELGKQWGEAEALVRLGNAYLRQGGYDLALELLQNSLDLRQQSEDIKGIAAVTKLIGLLARHQGDFPQAEDLQRQSIELSQQFGNRESERLGIYELTLTLTWAGKFRAASEAANRAIELERQGGLIPSPLGTSLLSVADIHLGRYSEALANAAEALALARKEGRSDEVFWNLMKLGNIAFVKGALHEAEHHLLESAAILKELRHNFLALPQAILSYVVRARGDRPRARHYLERALRLSIDSRSIFTVIYCLPVAALLAVDDARTAQAAELFSLSQQFGHIANSRWFREIANRELDEINASLSPEAASAARARGQSLDLWSTAQNLLLDLENRKGGAGESM